MSAEYLRLLRDQRTLTVARALANQLKSINFSCVKRVGYSFNPFHENVESIREMMFQFSVPKRRTTNPACSFKAAVRSDRVEPEMSVTFADGHRALFRTKNLSAVEICQEFNALCRGHKAKTTTKKS